MLFTPLAALIGVTTAAAELLADPIDTFANVTIFDPGDASRPLYARTVDLPNNTVLAAFSNEEQTNGTITIYRSTNSGFSWFEYGSAATDQTGRRLLQPYLLYTNATFGSYSGGATFLAVNAVDSTSTNIEIYASDDGGASFTFASRVATGGALDSTNGKTPVGDPFLLLHGDNMLTVYYSDSRDQQHAQKITQQTTTDDLDSWGSAIDVAAYPTYTDRPGMPTVAKLPDGRYLLAFEYAQLNSSGWYNYPIYYKISSSPENFATERDRKLEVPGGTQPNSSPFVTWSPLGGTQGTIVVSSADRSAVLVNQNLGEGTWKQVNATAGRAFAREVRVPDNDNTKLRFACGAEYDQSGPGQILLTVMDFQQALSA